jgi:signal transduction histidine kinase
VGERELLQACWMDWGALKEVLLSTSREFLPGADLRPALDEGARAAGPRLSSLPVQLLPGPPPPAPDLPWSSRTALLFGWACALAGTAAGAFVLRSATLQSERRGAFASAVAHELRTPLTTFRLYTELLAHGMVRDAEEQGELHRTLLAEADRLDHLVKNVLAYARLESRRGANLEAIRLGALLDRVAPRLAERARQAGMALEWCGDEEVRGRALRTDPLMVEQILLNLVDNACKYASAGTIRIALAAEGGALALRVEDQGPGVPEAERKRLFKPFQKIGPREARSAPGVGLGLALCRRLARMLGGDLRYEPGPEGGAGFILGLPLDGDPD